MSKRILVSEIFGPTVQGEGPLIGRPAVFVRSGGCDYRCAWCDTLYAVLPEHRGEWTAMTAPEILARIDELAQGLPILVTLSGGNPALQPFAPLIALGRAKGHAFAVETQGSVAADWFASVDWLIASPKPPSAKIEQDWAGLAASLAAAGPRTRCALKIVVFDDADYAYARAASRRHPAVPMYLQVGNPVTAGADADPAELMRRFRWLVDKVTQDQWFDATVLPQLHVLAWGNRRGV